MKGSQRVVKNVAWGLLAGAAGGGLQFVAVIVVARFLGVNDFGKFNYLLAFGTIFQVLADFGLSNILTREIARRPEALPDLLAGAKGLVWALFLALSVLLLVLFCFLRLPLDLKTQSFIMGFAGLTLLHTASYASVLRASEQMEFNAIGFTLHKVVLLAFTVIALLLGTRLWGVTLANLAANLLLWFYYYEIVTRRFVRVWPRRDLGLWKLMIKEAVPLGGGIMLQQCAWQVESLLLLWMVDSKSLGLFSGPYRLLLAVRVLSMILVLPVYPGMVRLAHSSPDEFKALYTRTIKWFCCFCLPCATMFIVCPKRVVTIVLGVKFLAATTALQWFGLAFAPMFISALYPYVFTALGRQRVFFAIIAGMLGLRIILDLVFIPRFGYMSACVIVALCESTAVCILAAELAYRGYRLPLVDILLKPGIAAVVMGGILYFSRGLGLAPAVLVICLAGAAYVAMLLALKVFSKNDLSLAREGIGFLRPYWNAARGKATKAGP